MKKILALLTVAALVLAGCDEPPPRTTDIPATPGSSLGEFDKVQVIDVNVNGRTVTCVTWDSNHGSSSVGGVSCDWANAKPASGK